MASPYLGLIISKKIEQKSSQTNLYVIIKASEILKLSYELFISIIFIFKFSLNHFTAANSCDCGGFSVEISKPFTSLKAFHILFEKFFPWIHSFSSNKRSFPAGAENNKPILTPSAP